MRQVPYVLLHLKWTTLVVAVFALNGPGFSQSSTPTPTTQEQVVGALQAASLRQETSVVMLERSLQLTQRELTLLRAEIRNDLDRRFLLFQILAAIVVIIGISSVASIWARLRKAEKSLFDKLENSLYDRVNAKLSERIEGIDPTNVPVHYPEELADRGELNRLKRFGYKALHPYKELDDACVSGIVIICLKTGDGIDDDDIKKFQNFVESHDLRNSFKVGFIVYNMSQEQFPRDIFKIHGIMDFASSPTTLSSNVMGVARNLDRFWDPSRVTEASSLVDDSVQQ